ncbi:MAG: heavy metal translocating P-type ATPase metal-binding domain-containing protein [Polyangiales bacterium]
MPSVPRCVHCAQPMVNDSFAPYCCRGCRTVHGILTKAGLTRYYDLRRGPGLPPADLESRRIDHKWLELLEGARAAERGVTRVELDIQGIHCAACVWLIEELFRRHGGTKTGLMSINPALGRVELRVSPEFPLGDWVDSVESLGYLLGPARSSGARASDDLLMRVGICAALAANVMLFGAAMYLGLREGPIYELLNQLSYAAGVLALLVGGSVFIGSAFRAVRRRVLHLDVPIALGIVLAFAGSTYSFFFASGHAAYIDTLTVFVALMLVGRWLQQRMLERNRAQLLADDGTQSLLTREIKDGVVRIVHCIGIHEGDQLLIAPGDLVPLDLRVLDPAASCSLDWIDGESRPRRFDEGQVVPAGAFNVGERAFSGVATTDFAASSLVGLLGRDPATKGDGPLTTRWWSRLSRFYVIGVVGLAAAGISYWWWRTGEPLFAIEVGTAVLVVTCPCAFGIAAPLAYELVLTQLRRAGVFVRVGDFLDRVRSMTRIVFDKTGTLTTGMLEVANPAALASLSERDITLLYSIAARSAHPKSVAVRRALEGHHAARFVELEAKEQTGYGTSAEHDGQELRLGAPRWAANVSGDGGDVVFSIDGDVRVALHTDEQLRPGARAEIERLEAEGYELAILSGDSPSRVFSLGASLGMAEELCIGGQNPEQKAAYVRAHEPARTLLIGDGLNDQIAMRAAACSGTPAVNRPFMASRCDFYFVSPGLHPVAQVLRASETLAHVVRRILAFAIAYNLVAVSLALAGLMRPWVAAVLMPLSSLITLAYTVMMLSRRRLRWRS